MSAPLYLFKPNLVIIIMFKSKSFVKYFWRILCLYEIFRSMFYAALRQSSLSSHFHVKC